MYDKPIELGNHINPVASVIWLHGLGADGNDFSPVIEMLDLPKIRFILPHAPYRKVTINNGHELRAWYDLYGLSIGSREDETGIRETQAHIEHLIEQELSNGIPSNKIVLAGFSQGGAIVLHTALRYRKKLAGVIALSTYLPLKSLLNTEKSPTNQQIPIFMAHGSQDEVISMATCQASLKALQTEKYVVDWHEYPMAHSVSIDEIDEIRTFLLRITE
ncbi:MAG: carboxylesterase [Methylophilaceae bacterium]|nr:MAG: carboxylesterase [Methylophilaceae bacterium]